MQLWHQNNFTMSPQPQLNLGGRKESIKMECAFIKIYHFKPEDNKLAIKNKTKKSLSKFSCNPTFAVMGTTHKSLQITVNSTEPSRRNCKDILSELDRCSSNVLLLTDSIRYWAPKDVQTWSYEVYFLLSTFQNTARECCEIGLSTFKYKRELIPCCLLAVFCFPATNPGYKLNAMKWLNIFSPLSFSGYVICS